MGEQLSLRSLSEQPVESALFPVGVTVPTASVTDGGLGIPEARPFEPPFQGPTPTAADAQAWVADVTASGEATARVPRQQSDDELAETAPIHNEIEWVASWLTEADSSRPT
ncbi:hypothetical protein AB0D66_32555 [Streptomyces sp. NPDC048270]|uniref:hypothetical protein n=1 Tax=Streptomyces sp. NPDC048270 TaxID=3154615 RepID=UPI0033CB0877